VALQAGYYRQPIGVSVFLDFYGFTESLQQLTYSAGLPEFSESEQDAIREGIQSILVRVYADFEICFSADKPQAGDYERIVFGQDGGGLGYVRQIDVRNQLLSQDIFVYSGNHTFILEDNYGRAENDSHATRLQEITYGLGNTAAHELGHAFGLDHEHVFGDGDLPLANAAGEIYDLRGRHNDHLLANGGTRIGEAQRESTSRHLSDFSRVMLEFADGLNRHVPEVTRELDYHDTRLTAQAISLVTLTKSDYQAAYVSAAHLGQASASDWYSISAQDGDVISVHLVSFDTRITDQLSGGIINLYDSEGNLLFSPSSPQPFNKYTAGTFGVGPPVSRGCFVANYLLSSGSGDYFIEVSTINDGDEGEYDLIVAKTGLRSFE
jgi:hypothetical protein